MADLIKSKNRVRDHGEVFTPDFIVQDMLDLVKDESERIESTFLEPACGNGNFLIEIIRRKMETVQRRYKKNQTEFEIQTLVATGSIYGVDLLLDNVKEARDRLNNLIIEYYNDNFRKKEQKSDFLNSLEYILDRNIIQGNALTYKTDKNEPIVFSSWSLCNGKISREDFSFEDLAEIKNTHNKEIAKNDRGEDIFAVNEIHKYKPIFYLDLYKQDDRKQNSVQSGCTGCVGKSQQGGSFHSSKNSKGNARFTTKGNMVGLFD